MKNLTVAYHDEATDAFGRVQVIAESAFPEHASRGFVEVQVADDGKVSKIDRDDAPDADAAQIQALQAKVAADAANSANETEAPAAAQPPATDGKPAGKPKPGGDA